MQPDEPCATERPALAGLPAVHRVLAHPDMLAAAATIPASVLTAAARHVLDGVRRQVMAGYAGAPLPDEHAIAAQAARESRRRLARTLRGAVNATGIVLHTGLGRARLADAAVEALADVAHGHSVLELDAETGRRGARGNHVRALLCELTGAEDALVLNNCAGAVFLAVAALAQGAEVIISRGELVEIGGAFRMPDIIRASGAVLVEVGTTNRTRIGDYRAAITGRTALILRCQPSNFAVVGFTEEAPTEEMVGLGAEFGVPVMDDQGSGAILSPVRFGLPGGKSTLGDSISSGCGLVTASGDKLLGGPQAGIVVGKRALVERVAAHPLARALRPDKLTLAALEATLRIYCDPDRALLEIPTLRYLNRQLGELTSTAEALRDRLAAALGSAFIVACVPETSQVGGGSLPGEELPTVCVSLTARDGEPDADAIAAAFRRNDPPIFARIRHDAVLLDPRTLDPADTEIVIEAARLLGQPRTQ